MVIPVARRLEMMPVAEIKENPRNPRIHPAAQLAKMVEAILLFGFLGAVLLDAHNNLISGHLRLAAARIAGLTMVPAIRIEHLSPAKLKAFAISDNQLATLSEWDFEILAEQFSELIAADVDFDLGVMGFEVPVFDAIVHGADFAAPDPADAISAAPHAGPPIARLNDLFELEAHRVGCGDARDGIALGALMGGDRATQIVTDMPFNQVIQGHVSGKGRAKHREFVMGSGELSEAEFAGLCRDWLRVGARACQDGALIYAFIDGAHLPDLIQAGRDVRLTSVAVCVWAKTNAGMGSLYRSQTEFVAVFKSGRGKHVNNVLLGKHGRNRSNLWTYPGMNSFGANRDAALKIHPAVKPVGLLADIILDASTRGDIVLDPFLGSGSTIIAAHRTGRRGFGLELDPIYVDAALDRLAAVIGVDPVRVSDGARWSELRRQAQEV